MSLYVDIEKNIGKFKLKVCFNAENETLALLGASGCGKSMTLKCIAGIETPDCGRIILDGITLYDSERGINLPPRKRHVGLLFQNYALFPNMTVSENIYAGANHENDKKKRKETVQNIMDSFGITELANHYPHQLSGGQGQRVALARILVSNPNILLLDEPFSALDSHLRFRMEREVSDVIHRFNKTVILVSHDRDEVYRMADSIAVMDDGHIEVCGDKSSVFKTPKTRVGALLTGCKNISEINIINENKVYAKDFGIELTANSPIADANFLGIRMHYIHEGTGENSVLCHVDEVIENPFSYVIMLRPVDKENTTPIYWETDKETWKSIQKSEISICLPQESLIFLR